MIALVAGTFYLSWIPNSVAISRWKVYQNVCYNLYMTSNMSRDMVSCQTYCYDILITFENIRLNSHCSRVSFISTFIQLHSLFCLAILT